MRVMADRRPRSTLLLEGTPGSTSRAQKAVKETSIAPKSTMVGVMLVDDHADFRRLVAAWVGRDPDLEVVAQAGSLEEARRHAASVGCDVAVLDMDLPDGVGPDRRAARDLSGLCSAGSERRSRRGEPRQGKGSGSGWNNGQVRRSGRCRRRHKTPWKRVALLTGAGFVLCSPIVNFREPPQREVPIIRLPRTRVNKVLLAVLRASLWA